MRFLFGLVMCVALVARVDSGHTSIRSIQPVEDLIHVDVVDPPAIFDFGKPLTFQIKNLSDRPVSVLDFNTREGSFAVKLKCCDTKEVVMVKRRAMAGERSRRFWNARYKFSDDTVLIGPGESQKCYLQLDELPGSWWPIPCPNTGQEYFVSVLIEMRNGRVLESNPFPTTFTSSKFKTIRDYVRANFLDHAKELLMRERQNESNESKQKCLIYTVKTGRVELASWIIDNTQFTSSMVDNESQDSLLHMTNEPRMVDMLLSRDASSSVINGQGMTPVMNAVKNLEAALERKNSKEIHKFESVIQRYREKGVAGSCAQNAIALGDLSSLIKALPENCTDSFRRNLVRLALKYGDSKLACYLLQKFQIHSDTWVDEFGFEPLLISSVRDLDSLEYLVKNGFSLQVRAPLPIGGGFVCNGSVLYHAAARGSLASFNFLLANGMEITDKCKALEGFAVEEEFSVLDAAIESGNAEVVAVSLTLLESSVERIEFVELLKKASIASLTTSPSVIELLLDKGLDPNVVIDEKSLLDHAFFYRMEFHNRPGIDEVIGILRNRGANASIFLLIELGDLNEIESLVKNCPHVLHAISSEGLTPLEAALVSPWPTEMTEKLLDLGANPNQKNDISGCYPLHAAVVYCEPESCLLLVKHSADIDVRNEEGDTALHLAFKTNHSGIADLLLRSGASISITNNREETALEVEKLRRHGGKINSLLFEDFVKATSLWSRKSADSESKGKTKGQIKSGGQ